MRGATGTGRPGKKNSTASAEDDEVANQMRRRVHAHIIEWMGRGGFEAWVHEQEQLGWVPRAEERERASECAVKGLASPKGRCQLQDDSNEGDTDRDEEKDEEEEKDEDSQRPDDEAQAVVGCGRRRGWPPVLRRRARQTHILMHLPVTCVSVSVSVL